jgi:hypothetical protein
MSKMLKLAGQKFGRLTVVEFLEMHNTNSYWRCVCDCGEEVRAQGGNLKNGHTQSCGCLRRDNTLARGQTENGRKTKLFSKWGGIMQRCYDPNHKAYKNYGGRGIKVCDRWLDFNNFREDVGECPDGMTFDRTNNNGDYEPGNWRWATQKEQMSNTRRNVWLTYNGETKTRTQWAKSLGIPYGTLRARLRRRWGMERAFTTPVGETT